MGAMNKRCVNSGKVHRIAAFETYVQRVARIDLYITDQSLQKTKAMIVLARNQQIEHSVGLSAVSVCLVIISIKNLFNNLKSMVVNQMCISLK